MKKFAKVLKAFVRRPSRHKRWHEDYRVTFREWKEHHEWHVRSNFGATDPRIIECPCDTQVGRFRKRDAWDCGNTRCYICHSDKFPKRDITYQEWCANRKLKEGIEQFKEEKDER